MQPILIRANKRNSISIAVGKNEYQFEYTKANIVSAQLTNYMKSMNNSTIERLPNCSIMMDGLLINEFNLYWNKSLITGEFRDWAKLKTMVKYKNEFLNSELIEDLFYLWIRLE